MDSSAQPKAPSRSRRRATEACAFCRRRKIKCNADKPTCANCKIYEQQCSYEPISEDAKEAGRERHHRVKRRRAQDQRHKHRQSNSIASEGVGTVSPAASPVSQSSDGPQAADAGQIPAADEQGASRMSQSLGSSWQSRQDTTAEEARVARILVSANGVSSYHGRTSALFEDNVQDRAVGGDQQPRMPDDWVERGLVAEAVRQRQLEELNFRQGKLDFDGVDPDLGMHLLSLHWNRQHHSFLVTYRPAFMRDMACGGSYFSKLLLNAIYFGAAKFSPRLEVRKDPDDVRTAGWQYRERVRELLGGSLDRSDVPTIQALLVMTNSLFALGDERSAAWLYSGLAFRMLIDLGMHVDLTSTRRFSDEDLEIRRRVFWGAFVIDKIQSLYQGRPVSMKEADAVVPIKFLDSYEELEQWQPFAYSTSAPDHMGSPTYSISTFTSLCKLSLVMSDILSSIYTERSHDAGPVKMSSLLDKLRLKLDSWTDGLPSHLHLDPSGMSNPPFPPPNIFSLHAMQHVLVILLHRPFVADGHLYSTSRSISVDCFMKCASAASSIVQLLRSYHRAFSIRRAPYLISYSTYVAATILTRIAAKRSHDSAAHHNLATCLAVFKENQETNSAVKKASLIVESLMKRLGVVVDKQSLHDLDLNVSDREREAKSLGADVVQIPRRSNDHGHRPRELVNTSNRQGSRGPDPSNGPTPESEYLDIDGIIQSFLQEHDSNYGARPVPQESFSTPAQMPRRSWTTHYQPPEVNMVPDYPPVGYQNVSLTPVAASQNDPGLTGSYPACQPQSWRTSSDGDPDSLGDPLFGFNGSSLDNFSFIGW